MMRWPRIPHGVPLAELAIAAIATVLLTTTTARPSLIEQIRIIGELRVVTRNSPTTYYLGPDGERGLEHDLIRMFAQDLGVRPRFMVVGTVAGVFPPLLREDVHLAAAGLTVTQARREQVHFGPVYQQVVQQVVYRYGTGRPREPGELIGGRIEVVEGSSHAETLRRIAPEHPGLEWMENPEAESEELLFRVSEGIIDYTISDSTELQLNQLYYPEIRPAFDISDQEPLAWAMRNDDDDSLHRAVDRFFERIHENGELEQLLERYYSHTDRFDYVGTRVFMRHIRLRLPSYEGMFREAAAEVGMDWRLIAAIGYQESHWNPRAVSPTGVRGIMMLTQPTAAWLGIQDRIDPRESIFGGARYFASVHRRLPARIQEPDRTWLALAAYNIGLGHLEDARVITQRHGADPDRWGDVREHLPKLSQRRYHQGTRYGYARGREPVIYVDNIRSYHDILVWLHGDTSSGSRARLPGDFDAPAPYINPPPL